MFRFAPILIFLVAALPALGAEEILSFDSLVEVGQSGEFQVTETIRVRAEGREIRRGIFRDIPLTFEDEDGRTRRNGFNLISAPRDGASETRRIEDNSGYVRIYLGDADIFLTPGVYTYELTYVTDRQLRFFDEHDEVYWNATGTEWSFPILEATARIVLPEGATVLNSAAFTGGFGAVGSNASSAPSPGGHTFWTTKPLGPREGLTVVVGFPKGIVPEPSASQRRAWFFRDNLGAIIAAAGTALVFGFYFVIWRRVGRDPKGGVMVPRWDAPDGVSPALTHYIWNRGLKGQGFPAISSAVLNLAVRGVIVLEDIGGTITLRRTDKPVRRASLAVGERAVFDVFSGYDDSLTISEAHGKEVSSLGTAFRRAMESEHRGVVYRNNTAWIFLGLALSAITVVLTLALGNPGAATLVFIVPLIFGGTVITIIAVRLAKTAHAGLAGKLRLIFFGFFVAASFINSGVWALGGLLSSLENPFLVGALATLLLTNVLFYFLIGAPTELGQKRSDEISGLRQYLSVSEKDRMNMTGAPEMSPQHYETLLPYAVALGLEKPWTGAFRSWLTRATAAGIVSGYAPGWHHGDWDSGSSIGSGLEDLGSKMASSFTASLPAPKSSSSGFSGGGSSGGGGGGGGGGGW